MRKKRVVTHWKIAARGKLTLCGRPVKSVPVAKEKQPGVEPPIFGTVGHCIVCVSAYFKSGGK